MKTTKHQPSFFRLFLLSLLLSACTVVPSDNYTLESGETINGDLWVLAGNAIFEVDTRINGSAFVLSGNVIADGDIESHLVATAGNVILGRSARVGGDVIHPSGSLTRGEGARVEGRGSIWMNIFLGLIGSIAICASPFLVVVVLIIWLVRRQRRVSHRPAHF
jgi:cytoskeletal protein CcmA (bactofilin family)